MGPRWLIYTGAVFSFALALWFVPNVAWGVPQCDELLTPLPEPKAELEHIVEAVFSLRQQGWDISQEAFLSRPFTKKELKLIERHTGTAFTSNEIYQQVTKAHRRSWAHIISQVHSKLKLKAKTNRQKQNSDSKKQSPKLSETELLDVFRKLHQNGIGLSRRDLKTEKDQAKVSIVTQALFSKAIPSRILFQKAIRLHPWEWWIEKLGLHVDQVTLRSKQLTKDQILKAIRALHEAGADLRPTAMEKLSPSFVAVISKATGRRVAPIKIYNDAVRPRNNHFSTSWKDWLIEAGVDPVQAKISRFPMAPTSIMAIIKAWDENDLPIRFHSILKSRDNSQMREIATRLSGFSIGPYEVIEEAVVMHGIPWRQWLRRAGFKWSKIDNKKTSVRKPVFSEAQIVNFIRQLYEQSIPINYQAMAVWNRHESFKDSVESVLGQSRNTRTLLEDAVFRYKRPWDWWLVQAGFDPNEIRLKGSAAFNLLTATMKAELASNYGAFDHTAVYQSKGEDSELVLIDEETPETQMRKKESSDAIEKFSQSLSFEDQEILDYLLDYFSQPAEFSIEALTEYVNERSDRYIEPSEIASLIQLMREEPELIEALL